MRATPRHLLLGASLATVLTLGFSPPVSGRAADRFTVDWAPCPTAPAKQCGTMQVPIDWSQPRGAKVAVAVARRPADDPARRIGTLFFNAGGPGDGEVKYVVNDDAYFSPTLRARFDIVGVDPRGTGNQDAIRCDLPAITPSYTMFPRTERQFDAILVKRDRLDQRIGKQDGAIAMILIAHP